MKDNILSDIKAMILDMDGVLWRQDRPLGDLPGIFAELDKRNLRITLATNNATLSVRQYLDKLEAFGVLLNPEQIVNSCLAAVRFLREKFPLGGPVYVIGEAGLIETLNEGGFYHKDEDGDILAVVVGMDRQLTYHKLCRATLLLRRGALFIGTNGDRTFPVPEGLVPGVGAILAALEIAGDSHPYVVGKPEPEMYKVALERMDAVPEKTLVVGDRLETDILGGQKLGCRTALVLSGVTSPEDAYSWKPTPDIIVEDLTSLLKVM